jgi:hypothetical protein
MLFCLPSTSSLAGDCLVPEAHPDSPHAYLLTLIDALGMAKAASDRLNDQLTPKADALANSTQLMLNLKLSNSDFLCATQFVAPYKVSSVQPIRTSAEGSETVFTALVSVQEQHIALIKKLWNEPHPESQTGSYMEALTTLGAKADDLWKTLPVAVIAATYAVAEVDPATGKMGRFTLTDAQRNAILKKLVSTFGTSIQQGMQVGQNYTDTSAAALYQFLSDKRWKTRQAP